MTVTVTDCVVLSLLSQDVCNFVFYSSSRVFLLCAFVLTAVCRYQGTFAEQIFQSESYFPG